MNMVWNNTHINTPLFPDTLRTAPKKKRIEWKRRFCAPGKGSVQCKIEYKPCDDEQIWISLVFRIENGLQPFPQTGDFMASLQSDIRSNRWGKDIGRKWDIGAELRQRIHPTVNPIAQWPKRN